MATTIATGPAPGSNAGGVSGEHMESKPLGNERLRVAAVFSHHMVLQRRKPIPVFGEGKPGTSFTVELKPQIPALLSESVSSPEVHTSSSYHAVVHGTVDEHGQWLVVLPAMDSGKTYRLIVSAQDIRLEYRDVLIGEVWIASGQSNIEFELHNALDGESEVALATDGNIRFFNTPKRGALGDELFEDENASSWQVCSPATAGYMSAIAYFFARKLRSQWPDVPVGIVDCYVGGTSISCWMSEKTLRATQYGNAYLERYEQQIAGKSLESMHEAMAQWQKVFDQWNADIARAQLVQPDIDWDTLNTQYGECPWPPPTTSFSQFRPTGPFIAMVSRVAPYAIRGALWYQGEEDEQYGSSYAAMLRDMIADWRTLWNIDALTASDSDNLLQSDEHDAIRSASPLPFVIAQLPQWIDKKQYVAHQDPMLWPVLRQAQSDVTHDTNDVYLTVLMDCGEFNNIHPVDKKTPGERLALTALRHVYEQHSIVADSPRFRDTLQLNDTQSPVIGVIFDTADGMHFMHDDRRIASEAVESKDEALSDFDVLCKSVTPIAQMLTARGLVPEPVSLQESEEQIDEWFRLRTASGFEVAGEDGDFHQAAAMSLTLKSDAVNDGFACIALYSPNVPQPYFVRYGYFSWGPAPVFNRVGLPAEPFNTYQR